MFKIILSIIPILTANGIILKNYLEGDLSVSTVFTIFYIETIASGIFIFIKILLVKNLDKSDIPPDKLSGYSYNNKDIKIDYKSVKQSFLISFLYHFGLFGIFGTSIFGIFLGLLKLPNNTVYKYSLILLFQILIIEIIAFFRFKGKNYKKYVVNENRRINARVYILYATIVLTVFLGIILRFKILPLLIMIALKMYVDIYNIIYPDPKKKYQRRVNKLLNWKNEI